MEIANGDQNGKMERLLRPLGIVFAAYFGVCTVALFIFTSWEYGRGSASLLWSSAAWVVGGTVGFLFGFPKIIQDDKTDPANKTGGLYRLLINTNFAEVSDWLTKIIVGLGLVHAKEIGDGLLFAGGLVSAAVSGSSNESALGVGVIVAFSGGGLLFGYLYTRLYLSLLFKEADTAAIGELKAEIHSVQAQTEEQIQSVKSQTRAAEQKIENLAGVIVDKVVSEAQMPDIQGDPQTRELLDLATQSAADEGGDTPLKNYLRAFNALTHRRFDEAIAFGEAALKGDLPKKRRWSLLNLLGLAHHYLQPPDWKPGMPEDWFEKSKGFYTQAIQTSPSLGEALVTKANYAFLLIDRGDSAEAEKVTRQIIDQEHLPDSSELRVFDLARIALAAAIAMQNRESEAAAPLNEIKNIQEWAYLFDGGEIPREAGRRLAGLENLAPAIKKFLAERFR